MSFYPTCLHYNDFNPDTVLAKYGRKDVEQALSRDSLGTNDFLTLLSPAAEYYIEDMAQKAHRLTVQHFGKVIQLYTPLYLSNFCTNQCLYCGFNTENKIDRKQLSFAEVEKEAAEIAKTGLKHILILTGGARNIATPEYIQQCIRIVAAYFSSVCIEVYELETEEYAELINFNEYHQEQAAWLADVFKSPEYQQADYQIVLVHIPPFEDYSVIFPEDFLTEAFDPVLALLHQQTDIDLVMSGHLHRGDIWLPEETGLPYPVTTCGGPLGLDTAAVTAQLTETGIQLDVIDILGNTIESAWFPIR